MQSQHCAIGIDIGGTNIRAARIAPDSTILRKKVVAGSRDPHEAVAIVDTLIREMDGPDVVGIGVGVPGRVDAVSGAVFSGGFLDLSQTDLKTTLARTFGRPVALANDCAMALIGETRFGAARGLGNVVMLTIGTGIGGAAMENGRVVNGRGSAGQLGHLIVRHDGRPCPCGERGCVETESSGTALRRHLDDAGYGNEVRIEEILASAGAADARAIALIEAWAGPLRSALHALCAAFDPSAFVLGGGLGQAAIDALSFLPEKDSWYKTDVVTAMLGDDAGVIGAGLAAIDIAVPRSAAAGKRLVMVNGVPASGKSRLSRSVSDLTGWPLLSIDAVKNPFLEHIEGVDRLFNRTLGRASYQAMFSIIRDAPAGSTFVMDAWFGFQPIDLLRQHLLMAGIGSVAELWCHAPPEIVGKRYADRLGDRLPGHPGASYVPELIELAGSATPAGVGPVLRIDTTLAPDDMGIIRWLTHAFDGSGAAAAPMNP